MLLLLRLLLLALSVSV